MSTSWLSEPTNTMPLSGRSVLSKHLNADTQHMLTASRGASPKLARVPGFQRRKCRRKSPTVYAASRDGIMSIVTFRASRRASLVVKAPDSSAPTIDEFLNSTASHPALLDSEVFYPLDIEGPGVYKCRGWEAS
eukprot:3521935-Pyramimonas_sp.AAC.4